MENLDRELQAYLETDGDFPMIRHPLVFAVPFLEIPEEVDRVNKQLAAKKEMVDKALANRRWSEFVFLHERPYRIGAFQEIHPDMTDREYWPLLRDVWTDSENIFQNHIEWWEALTSPRQRRVLFTSSADRAVLKKLPETIHVYRGTTQVEMDGHYLGFSWTLSEEKAVWFAKRFQRPSDGPPVIASADLLTKHAIGYIDGRGEQEIVVEPKELQRLDWELAE